MSTDDHETRDEQLSIILSAKGPTEAAQLTGLTKGRCSQLRLLHGITTAPGRKRSTTVTVHTAHGAEILAAVIADAAALSLAPLDYLREARARMTPPAAITETP